MKLTRAIGHLGLKLRHVRFHLGSGGDAIVRTQVCEETAPRRDNQIVDLGLRLQKDLRHHFGQRLYQQRQDFVVHSAPKVFVKRADEPDFLVQIGLVPT